jgi:hypothetical protein|tara:strand:+ start:130 stop:399 length:270 start_codon:yes stop_codon:yes gene_type:complete
MFILTDVKTGGVYATSNEKNVKLVRVFEQSEDALRYNEHLKALDYKEDLELTEVEHDLIALNCNNHGFHYTIISKDDLIVPPRRPKKPN